MQGINQQGPNYYIVIPVAIQSAHSDNTTSVLLEPTIHSRRKVDLNHTKTGDHRLKASSELGSFLNCSYTYILALGRGALVYM